MVLTCLGTQETGKNLEASDSCLLSPGHLHIPVSYGLDLFSDHREVARNHPYGMERANGRRRLGNRTDWRPVRLGTSLY